MDRTYAVDFFNHAIPAVSTHFTPLFSFRFLKRADHERDELPFVGFLGVTSSGAPEPFFKP